MSFNDRDYTREALIKQLGVVELHSKDGSALDAGCQCIETKHLFNIETLSEEGVGFGMTEKEKKFYQRLADFARHARKSIDTEDFSFPAQVTSHFELTCKQKVKACMKLGHSA